MAFPPNVASIRFQVEGLPDDTKLESWIGTEELHKVSEHIAVVSTNDGNLDLEKFVHKAAVVVMDAHENDNTKVKGGARNIKGMIRKAEVHADEENQFLYTFTFVPSLWGTTRNNMTRIFQEKNSLDIVKDILKKNSIKNDFKVSSNPPKREFCVQYQETDFDFISRLSEEDGYFFYVDQKEDKVIFTDKLSDLPKTDPMKEFHWDPGEGLVQQIPETVTALEFAHSSVIKKVAVKDYNYLTPEESLMKEKEGAASKSTGGLYHAWSKHTDTGEGDTQAKIQIEEKTSDEKILYIETTCRSAATGHKFKLKDYPGTSYNKDYIVKEIQHYYEDHHYRNVVACMPTDTRYRPPRVTPRPCIVGLHTGRVTGPSGEKVYTDDKKLGRVKVRLNWDLTDNKPEEASCWMRSIRSYAGNKWGHHFLPRVGDEVMVTFLDGDPDRPIITGSIHNATNVPPVKLPDDKFQNMIRTPFGHQFVFEDKEGKEKIELFTKDQKNYIKLDHGSGGHQIEINSMEGKKDVFVKKDISTKTDQNWILNTKDSARITAKKDASITTTGKTDITAKNNITIDGKMNISVKGTGAGTLKISQGGGSVEIDPIGNVKIKGIMVEIQASAILTLSGSLIKIN